MKVGVLALQGAFIEHEKMLSRFGISCAELRQASDLNKSCDGLIVGVQYGRQLAFSFHPELDRHMGIHQMFVHLL